MSKNGIIRAGRLLELEAVAAVARQRNFRQAARDLGLSTTTLSRTIAAIEERLGVQLFTRTTRSVSLTSAGARFVTRMEPALREIGDALNEVTDQRDVPSGPLRINCSAGAARQILDPVILPFLERFPEIALDLVTDDRLIDIVAEGFDAGIRQHRSVPGGMERVAITRSTNFVVVGAPAYLAGRPVPESPSDLMAHRCIRIRMASGENYAWEFLSATNAKMAIDVQGPLILDDPSLMHKAALSGAGLAYIAQWRVETDIAEGRLVALLGDWVPQEDGLILYHPSTRHPSAALRALIDLVGLVAAR